MNLKRENVDAWLQPQGRSSAELQGLLTDPQPSYYEHVVEEAA